VALHHTLWYHDNDTVSFRYDEINKSQPDRATVARYRVELGVTESPQETIWQYRRGAGFVLGHGVYQSFFDLHGGYFDDPRLMAEVARLNGVFAESAGQDRSSIAEILVISDEASCSYATFESGFLQQTLRPAQVQLAKIGAPHDSILVDDLALADASRYRLVVFLNCFHLADCQRELIRRTVLQGDRTVVWAYAPGLFNGHTASLEAIGDLSGFSLVRRAPSARWRLTIALSEAGRSWWRQSGGGEPPASVGHEHVWGEPLAVDDAQATVLGHLETRPDFAALATKSMAGWTSLYTLNPAMPAAFLRAVARRAGVHLFNDRNDTLYASRSYLTINADGPGVRTLRFTQPVDLFDPFSGEIVARGATAWNRLFQDKETLIVRYSPAEGPKPNP
jgi:hypothetical protein